MTGRRLIPTLLLAGLTFTGCAAPWNGTGTGRPAPEEAGRLEGAREAASLEERLTAIVEACGAQAGPEAQQACHARREADLLGIARQAGTLAERTPDARDRVSRYALAGQAGMLAGQAGYPFATTAAQKGGGICEVPPPAQAGRPGARDCALLFAMPGLAEHSAAFPGILRLRDDLRAIQDQPGLSEARRRSLLRERAARPASSAHDPAPGLPALVDPYFDNAWLPLQRSWTRICALPGRDPAVDEYLLEQQRRVGATYRDGILDASRHLHGGRQVTLQDTHCRALEAGRDPLAGQVDRLRLRAWCHAQEIRRDMPRDTIAACAANRGG